MPAQIVKIEWTWTKNAGGLQGILSQKFKTWEGKNMVRKTDDCLFHITLWPLK